MKFENSTINNKFFKNIMQFNCIYKVNMQIKYLINVTLITIKNI